MQRVLLFRHSSPWNQDQHENHQAIARMVWSYILTNLATVIGIDPCAWDHIVRTFTLLLSSDLRDTGTR